MIGPNYADDLQSAREGFSTPYSFNSDISKSNFEAVSSNNIVCAQGFYFLNYNLYMNCNRYNEFLSSTWIGNDQSSLNSQQGSAKRIGSNLTNQSNFTQSFFTNNQYDFNAIPNSGMLGVTGQLFNNYTNPFSGVPWLFSYNYYASSNTYPSFPDMAKNVATKVPIIRTLGPPCSFNNCPEWMNLCEYGNAAPFYNLDDVFCRSTSITPIRNVNALNALPLLPPPNNTSDTNDFIDNSTSKIMLFIDSIGFSMTDIYKQNRKLKSYLTININIFSYEESLFAKDILMHWFGLNEIEIESPTVSMNSKSKVEDPKINDLSLLFPNPNYGFLKVKENSGVGKIILRNIEGKFLLSESITDQSLINISTLSGLIICEIYDTNGALIKMEKIIVIN